MNKGIILIISMLQGGGAEHVLFMLANHFNAKNIPVKIIVTNQIQENANFAGLRAGIECVFLEMGIKQKTPTLAHRLTNAMCRYFQATKSQIPDRLVNCSFMYLYGEKVALLRKTLFELPGWTCLAFLAPANHILLKAADGLDNPLFISERSDPYKYFRTRYAPFFLREYYPKLSGMVFQTDDAQKAYHQYVSVNSVVIFNPVSSQLPKPWYGEREKTVVNFCRLTPEKNLFLLLEAFEIFWENHNDYRLQIIGDGELKDRLLKDIIHRNCAEHIELIPFTNDVHSQILKAGMFVSSSNYEGMSNSMIEAMALGLPVICTNCPIGGAAAVIKDGVNGLLVPVNDPRAMASAMATIADQRSVAASMTAEAAKIRELQAENVICEQWESFLFSRGDKRINECQSKSNYMD